MFRRLSSFRLRFRSVPDSFSRIFRRAPGAAETWAAALAAAHVFLAWFAPAWLGPFALTCILAAAAFPRLRDLLPSGAVPVAAMLLAFFALKDFATPGPVAAALSALDPGSPAVFARQPDWPRGLVSLGNFAAILLAVPVLRVVLARPRIARAASLGLVLALATIAIAILTHPASAANYGKTFQLGAVANRNPAAGAFALGTILALGLALDALRAARRSAIPAFALTALLACATIGPGSRGGILALAAGAGWLLYQENRKRSGRLVILACGLGVSLLLLAPGPLSRLVVEGETYRVELAAASLRALAHAPWGGLGLDGFQAGFPLLGGLIPAEGMKVVHPDVGWVLALAEWGVLGFFAVVIAGIALLRPAASPAPDSPALVAQAGLVAWAAAAMGDISFHRPELLVTGLLFLALRFPAAPPSAPSSRGRPAAFAALALAALLAVATGSNAIRSARDRAGPESAARHMPLDPATRHRLGNQAMMRGDIVGATAHYAVVAALEPANTKAIQPYARAIAAVRPDLALALWKRLLAGGAQRAHALLGEELVRPGTGDASYWMSVLDQRPELWAQIADTELPRAQSAYEKWRRAPLAALLATRPEAALGAVARWGSVAELDAWLAATRPAPDPAIAITGARLLGERGRDDLAWRWLVHHFPKPATVVSPPDAGLGALVRANPDDLLAAAKLLDQTTEPELRLALLARIAARPGAPALFHVRLAHELNAAGRRQEALEAMLRAAALAGR